MHTKPIANLAAATPVEIDTRATELTFMITKLNNEIKRLERHQEFGWTIDVDKLLNLRADRRDLTREYCALSSEFSARGTWSRYYLALSHNGHVHSSMRCSTCNRGRSATQFIRLDTESGATPEAVVTKAKAQACTTCFPWAPVTTERGEYRTPDQEEKERKAAERAARKAATDAIPRD